MKNNNKATNLGRQGQGGASGQSGSSAVEELSRNLSLALMAAANGNNASGLPRQSPTSEEPGQVKAQDGVPDPAQSELAKALELAVARKKAAAITEMSSSSSSVGARPSTATSISPVDEETSSATRKKSANVKKDRSKLRKGKWTVEEEEYTTRIIHHFSTGILTLPEGATLRSYLADKLNCDPMRITKKFAGASCLGRRVFHLRNRPQPSYEEIQMAKAELDQLEQRFRLRVEHGYGGMPLTNRPEMMLKFSNASGTPTSAFVPQLSPPAGVQQAPTSAAANGNNSAVTTAATAAFLQNFAAAAMAAGANNGNSATAALSALQLPAASGPAQSLPAAQLSALAGVPGAAQWLLPNPPTSASSSAPAPSADASVRAVNDVVTNWAWAQIAASLSGALPQLSQANLQQQQQLVASLSNIIPQLAAANFQQQQQQKVQPIHAQRFQQQQQQAPLRPSSAPLPAIHPRQHSQLPLQDAAKSRGELQHNELLPQPAFVQQKEERPSQKELDSKDLQNKKVHAEEASSFAHQLRIAYEKQLRAREEAEKKKAAEAKATNASSKKSDAHSNSPKSTENSKSQNKLRPSKNGRSKLTTASHKPKAVKIATTGGANKAKFSSKEEKQSSEETAVGVAANNGGKGPRTQEEEAAGSILLGFLSSLRDSYEDALRKKKPAVPGPSVTNDSSKTEIKKRPHQQTKEASVKKQKLQENAKPSNGSSHASIDTKQKSPQTTTQPLSSVVQKESKKPNIVTAAKDKKKASVHVSAASSLADSYRQFTSNTLQNRRHPPNYITDMSTSTSETSSGNNSTNPVESSLEDSDSNSDKCGDINSDKGGKDNPSSSEEDDKIIHSEGRKNHYRSKGPPRKRIKTKMMDEAQTTRSVLEEEKQRIDK